MQFLSACNLPKYLKVQTYLSKNSHKQVAQANCSKAIYKPPQRRLGFGGVKPGQYLKVQTYLSKNSHKQVAQANCSKAIYKPPQRRLGFGGVKPGLRNSYSNQTLSVQHITVHLCSRLSHPKKVSD